MKQESSLFDEVMGSAIVLIAIVIMFTVILTGGAAFMSLIGGHGIEPVVSFWVSKWEYLKEILQDILHWIWHGNK